MDLAELSAISHDRYVLAKVDHPLSLPFCEVVVDDPILTRVLGEGVLKDEVLIDTESLRIEYQRHCRVELNLKIDQNFQ